MFNIESNMFVLDGSSGSKVSFHLHTQQPLVLLVVLTNVAEFRPGGRVLGQFVGPWQREPCSARRGAAVRGQVRRERAG